MSFDVRDETRETSTFAYSFCLLPDTWLLMNDIKERTCHLLLQDKMKNLIQYYDLRSNIQNYVRNIIVIST